MTYCRNHDLQLLTKQFNKLPNLVYTYYVFFCFDNSSDVKNNSDFSYPIQNNKYVIDCYHVTYEIMHYYKRGSLLRYMNKYDKKQIFNVLQQLLYCQLNIFAQYMYTHNDIKLSNILVNKQKNRELKYEYINKKIITDYEYILSDYDRIIVFNQILCFSFDEKLLFSLFSNICQTIELFNIEINNKQEMFDKTKNNIEQYVNKKINSDELKTKELSLNCSFVDDFLMKYIMD